MKKVTIEEATTDQIIGFAKNILQVEKVPTDRAGAIAMLIASGYNAEFIAVPGEEEDEDALQAQGAPREQVRVLSQFAPTGETPTQMPSRGFPYWTQKAKDKPKCPMVTLRILPTDRPGGNEPAHPIVNNSPPLVIQRNKLVDIPYDFYLVLRQAGGTKYLPGEKPNDPLIAIDYFEYPMVDVVMPSQAECDAWAEWSGQNELGSPRVQQAA